jgi:GT2 family glycosyltransferase
MSVQLLAVIVLWKCEPKASASLTTLLAARNVARDCNLKILLYDNTPGGQAVERLESGVQYESAARNAGLAGAYNRALEMAQDEGYSWLLTLDQDTSLPPHFLQRISELAAELSSDASIAAIVPQILGDGRMLSPHRFWGGAIPKWFSLGFVGIPSQATYALNSASTLRVDALAEIGGYDSRFPLDCSDTMMFHRLNRSGRRIFVAGDLHVAHELSLLDMNQRMSLSRYERLLRDECAFWDMEMGPVARFERKLRLVWRLFKHWKEGHDPVIREATRKELIRRLVCPRRQRITEWEREVEMRS